MELNEETSPLPEDGTRVVVTAQVCLARSWIIVLLKEEPPAEAAAFAEWCRARGLPFPVQTDGDWPTLQVGEHAVVAYAGTGKFPEQRLRSLGAPEGFDNGSGFLGLSLGALSRVAELRERGQSPFAERGPLRELSHLSAALLELGTGVVLPLAGCARSKSQFLERLGANQLVRAWAECAVFPETERVSLQGLRVFGLPDLELAHQEPEQARDALWSAAEKMAAKDAPLKPGETVETSLGQCRVVASHRPTPSLKLEPEHSARAASRWMDAYRERFREEFCFALSARHQATVETAAPQVAVHVTEAEHGGFYLVTNGLAASRAESPFEVVAAMKERDDGVCAQLGAFAGFLQAALSRGEKVEAGKTFAFGMDSVRAAGVFLHSAGDLELKSGPRVALLELIPVSSDELQRLTPEAPPEWLEAQGMMTPARRASRWRATG